MSLWELGVSIILLGIPFFLIYISGSFNEQHTAIKSLLTFLALLFIVPILWVARSISTNTTVTNLIEYIFYGYIPVITFLFYYLVIWYIKEIIQNFMIERMKKKGLADE